MKPDDMRIPDSFELAEQEGLSFSFANIRLPGAHPNTAVLEVEGKNRTVNKNTGILIGGRPDYDR